MSRQTLNGKKENYLCKVFVTLAFFLHCFSAACLSVPWWQSYTRFPAIIKGTPSYVILGWDIGVRGSSKNTFFPFISTFSVKNEKTLQVEWACRHAFNQSASQCLSVWLYAHQSISQSYHSINQSVSQPFQCILSVVQAFVEKSGFSLCFRLSFNSAVKGVQETLKCYSTWSL